MRIWLACLMFGLAATMAVAGPWARDKGRSFMALSFSASVPRDDLDQPPKMYGAFYMERGLGHDITMGLDFGIDPSFDNTSIFFLRRSIGGADGPHRFAVQGGGGSTLSNGTTDFLAYAGASWGRGIKTGIGNAWAVLDMSMQYRLKARDVVAKADLTVGLKPTESTKIMLQFQAGDYPGSPPYLRLAPSIARKFGERVHVELGAQFGVVGDEQVGLKLATWLEF